MSPHQPLRYLRDELAVQLKHLPDADRLVEQIWETSEGVFLCEDGQQNRRSLDHPEQFSQGLGGIFFQLFQRQFRDLEKFRKDVRPALRAILAGAFAQIKLNWQDRRCSLNPTQRTKQEV